MVKYDEATKAKALAIAETAGIRAASEQTGMPIGTIKWLRAQTNPRQPANPTNRLAKKMEPLQAAAMEKAIEEAGDYIAERLKSVANQLYALAEKAAGKVSVAISDSSELPKGQKPEPHTTDGAAWVRALVGVLAQSVDKAQLLSGKPTGRLGVEGKVTERHEYDITYRIEQYADTYRTLARRSLVSCGHAGDNPGKPLDTA